MALGYQPAEFQYGYTLIVRGAAYAQTSEYPIIAALAGKHYQPAEDLLKLYESGYYTNTYQNEDIAGMLALQSIANRNNGTAASQADDSNACVQGNRNSNNNGRIIGDKYYGHYYSSYGLCTYFNY